MSNGDKTGQMIQLRIVCILHINNETDMNGNLMLLNLPYLYSSVPVDQIYPTSNNFMFIFTTYKKKSFRQYYIQSTGPVTPRPLSYI